MPKINWITRQKSFFEKPAEFSQVLRVQNFFRQNTHAKTMLIDESNCFENYFTNRTYRWPAEQTLYVCNCPILLSEFEKNLMEINQNTSNLTCILLNKFLLYNSTTDLSVIEDYDDSLLVFVKNIFADKKIEYVTVKDHGDRFNFAVPVTQFYITNELY